MTFFWLLVIASGVSAVLLIASLVWYWINKRKLNNTEEDEVEPQEALTDHPLDELHDEADHGAKLHNTWVELLDQQSAMCTELMQSQDDDDLTLRCWQTFLEIEREILTRTDVNVADFLHKFEFVLERLKQAQEVDALLKQLSVSNQLLKQLNKIVQKTGDSVFEQMNITANLNLKLDKLQEKLLEEVELDQELAEIRAELASLYELSERLKLAAQDKNHAEDFMGLLDEFVDSAASDSFLTPIKTELDDKVSELQHLATYQSQVIESLKVKLKGQRDSADGQSDHLAEYDVAFARLEKSLLESNKAIKALEHKLESLQTIKYNLNVDKRKRDEEIKAKDAKLKASGVDVQLRAQDAIARERSSVDAIASFMDTAPLTAEYIDFEEQQSGKLSELQQLVNESELYVNVLERDLEKEKVEHEQLLLRLESEDEESLTISDQEKEELDNLKEINAELENEKISLLEQLSNTSEDTEAMQELQYKIKELDLKIETVQANYVSMEERYLNSLMS